MNNEKNIIFFDVETNGLSNEFSVLSMSAMKISYNLDDNSMRKIDVFDRYYYRNEGEEPNYKALDVNKLYDEEITNRRKDADEEYPLTFKEDMINFKEFCKDTEHYVAHNIRFDRNFVDFILPYQFDTMIENINELKIPNNMYGGFKWPKLMQCASYYNISIEDEQLHNSMYDVLIMARVFYKMTKSNSTLNKIRNFVVDNNSTKL